jgi:hypothetical protein
VLRYRAHRLHANRYWQWFRDLKVKAFSSKFI